MNPTRFSSTIAKFDSNLWGFHFIVQEPMARIFVEGADRRVVCTLNGVVTFQCALMPHGDGNFFINVNKHIRDRLKLKVGSTVEVSLVKDESEYGLTMCEEMKELLEMDEEGHRLFHALTPGKQRSLIYWASTPKNSDGRIRRSLAIVDHLKANAGKVDFKVLNKMIKIDPELPG